MKRYYFYAGGNSRTAEILTKEDREPDAFDSSVDETWTAEYIDHLEYEAKKRKEEDGILTERFGVWICDNCVDLIARRRVPYLLMCAALCIGFVLLVSRVFYYHYWAINFVASVFECWLVWIPAINELFGDRKQAAGRLLAVELCREELRARGYRKFYTSDGHGPVDRLDRTPFRGVRWLYR